MSFWFDEQKRLEVAKQFQIARIEFIKKICTKDKELQGEGFYIDDQDISLIKCHWF
jgi:CRISPR-associated protein Cas1